MLSYQNGTHLLTLTLTALIAGLFYGYSCSVNPGLGRLADAPYLKAMQAINAAILNPVFFASFIGSLIALPVCTWMRYRQGAVPESGYLLAATLIYAMGVFGVTAVGNVPLNNALAGLDISSLTPDQLRLRRVQFEGPWNRYHQIRTVCAVITFVLAAIPLFKR